MLRQRFEPHRHPLQSAMIAAMVAWLMFSGAAATAALQYQVTIDASPVAGQAGNLDLQFNPGNASAPASMVALSLFTSNSLLGSGSSVDGNVTGSLPGDLLFGNTTVFNAFLQPLQSVGTLFGFTLTFDDAFLSASSGAGTTFSVALLGPDPDFPPLLQTDADGRILTFELSPGAIRFAAFDPGVNVVAVTAVPEPATVGLLLAGVAIVGLSRRRVMHGRRRT